MNTTIKKFSVKFSYESHRFWEPGSTGILLAKPPAAHESVRISLNEKDQNEIASNLNLRLPTLLEIFRAAVSDPQLREALVSPVRISESGFPRPNLDYGSDTEHSRDNDFLYTISGQGKIVKVQRNSTNPEETISISGGPGRLVFVTNNDKQVEEWGARYSLINGWHPENNNHICAFIRNYFGPVFPGKIMDYQSMIMQNSNVNTVNRQIEEGLIIIKR